MKKTILSIALFCIAWSIIMALTADVPLLKNNSAKAHSHLNFKRKVTAKSFAAKAGKTTVKPQ